jgi:hypothetical protein
VSRADASEQAWLAAQNDTRIANLFQGAWNCSDLQMMHLYAKEQNRRAGKVVNSWGVEGSI